MAVTITLTGDKKLDRLFSSLPKKVQGKVIRPALREAAKIISAKAKTNAPVDTGLLRESLRVRAGKRTRKNVIRVLVQTEAGFYKGKTFYGAFQEFGHRQGSRKLGNARQMIEGKHYIKRAYDSTANRAKAAAQQLIINGIVREAVAGG